MGTKTRIDLIAQVAQSYIDKEEFSNIEWCIQHRDTILDAGCIGFADIQNQSPLPKQPIYRIYSMTKPVVAALAVMLLERCQLHLFDLLGSWLPAYRNMNVLQPDGSFEPAAPITLDQLFTHRAGFSYDFMPDCPTAQRYREVGLIADANRTLEAFVDTAALMPLAFQPGTRWHYSIAIDILARVIEIAAGESLADLLEKELFDPLGMDETRFFVAPDQMHRLLPMFGKPLEDIMIDPLVSEPLQRLECEASCPSTPESGFARGGHGLFSTTHDYLRFAHFTLTGCTDSGERLLSRKMVDFMWQNRLPTALMPIAVGPFPRPGYGWNLLGRVMLDPGQAYFLSGTGEGGWSGAASTYYWVDRSEDLVGIVMTQNLGALSAMPYDIQAAAYQAID